MSRKEECPVSKRYYLTGPEEKSGRVVFLFQGVRSVFGPVSRLGTTAMGVRWAGSYDSIPRCNFKAHKAPRCLNPHFPTQKIPAALRERFFLPFRESIKLPSPPHGPRRGGCTAHARRLALVSQWRKISQKPPRKRSDGVFLIFMTF